MIDGQRKYPVNIFVLHHSVGPRFANETKLKIQDWFSNIGRARGYQNGAINPRHEHPSRSGQLTYAMAQYAGHPYTKDGNKYGYRLLDLIKHPIQNVAWHAGNWEINQRSLGLENCGDFRVDKLTDKQLMCIADFLRPIDKELGGTLQILLHSEIYATECPASIKNQRNKLVDMVNNPAKWNKQLWPPKSVVTTKTEIATQVVPYTVTEQPDDKLPLGETKVLIKGANGLRTITYEVTYTDGKETGRKVKSDVTKEPTVEVVAVGSYVEPPAPEKPEPSDSPVVTFLTWLIDLIKKLWNKEK